MPSRERVVLERLSPWFLARILAMFNEMGVVWSRDPATGFYHQSAIVSAWRSYEHQVELYNAPHEYPVAKPGHSNHEGQPPDGLGHAVDWNWWAVGAAHALSDKYKMCWPVVKPRYENWHMESVPGFVGNDMGYELPSAERDNWPYIAED